MTSSERTVQVRVPATTANVGPGFDAVGIALRLYNRFRLTATDAAYEVHVTGDGADGVPTGEENFVFRAAEAVWRELGRPVGGWRVHIEANIPPARGLGSSATAIVAGAVAANALAGGPLDDDALLRIVAQVEGHADNVTAALLGGFTVAVVDADGTPRHQRLPVPDMRFVVAVPEVTVSTEAARGLLPATLAYDDATFNVGRAALLAAMVAAGNVADIGAALADRMHEPYRATLVPGFSDVTAAARRAGALGAVLSGAGPSVIAPVAADGRHDAVAAAMAAAFRAAGVDARCFVLAPDQSGAQIETPVTGEGRGNV